jgi:hypothetical protein
MTFADIDAITSGMVPAIRAFVAKELTPLKAENAALRARVDALEVVVGLRKAINAEVVR